MGIGTSDGQYYETEWDFVIAKHGLDKPSTTVETEAPITTGVGKSEPEFTQKQLDDLAAGAASLPSPLVDTINRMIEINRKAISNPDKRSDVKSDSADQLAFSRIPGPAPQMQADMSSDYTNWLSSRKRVEPYVQQYPNQSDIETSRKVGLSYGDPASGFIDKPGTSMTQDISISGVKSWYNDLNPNPPIKYKPSSKEDVDRVHEGWLAARRSPLAQLGFKPGKMMTTPEANLTIFGAYNQDTDKSWYNTDSKSTQVHESIHRGVNMLRKQDLLPKNFPDEELVVRRLMDKYFPGLESKRDDGGKTNEQLQAAKRLVSEKDLETIENIAAKYIAKKRPMGPR